MEIENEDKAKRLEAVERMEAYSPYSTLMCARYKLSLTHSFTHTAGAIKDRGK